jgi:hypothetical protein
MLENSRVCFSLFYATLGVAKRLAKADYLVMPVRRKRSEH